jgi:hypothetical protein
MTSSTVSLERHHVLVRVHQSGELSNRIDRGSGFIASRVTVLLVRTLMNLVLDLPMLTDHTYDCLTNALC